jgi:hypothetical protein
MRLHPQDGPHADVRIRISDEVVTFSIQMNVAFLDEIADIPRENMDDVAPVEEQSVIDAFIALIREKNKVTIDGFEVKPALREVTFHRPGPEFLPLFPQSGWRGLLRVQAIIDYPSKSAPQSISMIWGGYPRDLISAAAEGVDPDNASMLTIAALLTAEGTEKIINFSQAEPEFTWHAEDTDAGARFLPVPDLAQSNSANDSIALPSVSLAILGVMVLMLISIRFSGHWPARRKACYMLIPIFLIASGATFSLGTVSIANPFRAGPKLPTPDEAKSIFLPLHANIYRAFDYTSQDDIYDALAQSVDGELLDSLYNEVYRSLIMQEEGGAVSRVQSVTPIETTVVSIGLLPPDDQPGFTVRTRWQVEGAVYHWGHSHTRVNEYEAEYSVIGGTHGWRIAGNRIIEQFRLDPEDAPAALPIELKPGMDI